MLELFLFECVFNSSEKQLVHSTSIRKMCCFDDCKKEACQIVPASKVFHTLSPVFSSTFESTSLHFCW